MRSSNPVLSANSMDSFRGEFFPTSQSMTIQGAATKSLILLGLCIGTGSMTFAMTQGANPGAAMPWMIGGVIGSLIFGMATTFKPTWAPTTAPLYALAEGLLLGAISGMYEKMFNGIVPQAALATLGTMAAMLFAYKTGVIKASRGFVMGVAAATGGIALMYFVAMICSFFGIQMSFLYKPSPFSIAISVGIVIVAALNLIIDFAAIQQAAAQGAPKYYEWYTAFGLMVTLVWLYVEILRLLSLIASSKSND
ncbi:Bax inhibitor-1/YccA family protein [Schlesneria paludicola]|uniref:Bax inhibitor-1/YccA family protein n=1 Tax=Schlesneria paludicola TaxID=360056 RepID=UPI000492AF6E